MSAGAAAAARGVNEETWKYHLFSLAAHKTAWQGARACIDTSTGYCVPAVAGSSTLVPIGVFAESVDNAAGASAVDVNVNLDKEIVLRWFNNDDGGGAIASTDLLKTCYLKDDQTVTISSASNSAAGQIWAVDTSDGVAVRLTTL